MPDREKVIEGLEHGLMICEATGTELVHIKKADAEEILSLLKEQQKLIDDITQRRINNGEFD